MSDDALRQRAARHAAQLEAAGDVEQSVRYWLQAGALDEAVRVLVKAARHRDAGELLVAQLALDPARGIDPDVEVRKRAYRAAVCFAHARMNDRAVQLFVAIGEVQRAAEVLQGAGDPDGAARLLEAAARRAGDRASPGLDAAKQHEAAGRLDLAFAAYMQLGQRAHAARVVRKAGRPLEAARLFDEAGMPYECGVCEIEGARPAQAVASLCKVVRTDPRYRKAVVLAVRAASEADAMSFALDQFVSGFLETTPRDAHELEALYQLGRLYERHEYPENARDVYRLLARAQPGHRDVATRLDALSTQTRSRKDSPAKRALRRSNTMPSLPPLRPPQHTAMPQQAAAQAATVPVTPQAPLTPDVVIPRAPPTPALGAPPQPPPAANVAPPAQPPSAPQPAASAALVTGQKVAGRYVVLSKLGQGGMAAVYRVRDEELSEEIALKLFAVSPDDASLVTRFKQELSLSRQIAHPNVIRLYDLGMHEGRRFLTMELLEGRDLSKLIDARRPDVLQGLRYMIQACAGLAAAHDKGIVHRDVKPENFFVTREGVVKLMDFGIARRQAVSGVTRSGFIAGTPVYMSPEQITSFATVTHLTDLYALGVMAFEMFTGTLPFDADELVPLLMMHQHAPVPAPRSRNPEVPPALEEVILKLLEKKPEARIASCHELAQRLIEIQRGLEVRRAR